MELAAPARATTDAADLDVLIRRLEDLLPRYLEGGPRYTSYPTAPAWTEGFGAGEFREALGRLGEGDLSVYVHVPFCRSLCHFCACNRLITRDEGLAFADSPTNLMWRLQNDTQPVSRAAPKKDEPDTATYTEYTIDVYPEGAPPPRKVVFGPAGAAR